MQLIPANLTPEQAETMTSEDLTKLVFAELRATTWIFASFGEPTQWPVYAQWDDVQQEIIMSLYRDWRGGKFDNIAPDRITINKITVIPGTEVGL